jgi:hypothetical protein
MCYFKSVKFKLYPEQTRIHLGYQLASEADQQWRERARLTQRMQNDENREHNKRGLIQTCQLAQRKAAERKSEYKA